MSKNKKILFIINGLGYGGAETHLLRLSKALLDKNFKVSILTITDDLDLLERLDKRIIHINIPLRKNLYLVKDIKNILKTIKQLKPDIIHAHLFQANLISRMIKVFYPNIRVINTTHCIYDNENIFGVSPYKLYQLTKRWTDFHTAVSKEALDKLIQEHSVYKNKSTFIPNGLFVDNYKHQSDKSDKFKWIAIGRLIPVKNYSFLIESFAKVIKQYPDSELHIVGDGECKGFLLKNIEEKNLDSKVKLLGLQDNIPELLSKYNALVISSKSEGLPMVLLEAMSAKLPIVSTSVGEIKEILEKSRGGILVNTTNKSELSDKMIELIQKNNAQIKQMGQDNFNFVKKEYDINSLVNKWVELYVRN